MSAVSNPFLVAGQATLSAQGSEDCGGWGILRIGAPGIWG